MRVDTEQFLMHYGKKGMHWGIRNAVANRYDKQEARQLKTAKSDAKKQAKLDKAMKKVQNKPLYSKDSRKHMSTFQKTMLSIGTGVTIGAIGALARPTLDKYGKKIAQEVAIKVAARKAGIRL